MYIDVFVVFIYCWGLLILGVYLFIFMLKESGIVLLILYFILIGVVNKWLKNCVVLFLLVLYKSKINLLLFRWVNLLVFCKCFCIYCVNEVNVKLLVLCL